MATLILSAGGVWAETPLSAIDWLSESVATPVAMPDPANPDATAMIEGGALPLDVSVSVLDGPSPDAVGLLPAAVTGLPRNLWGLGRTDDIVALLGKQSLEGLPALQSLLITLLLAEAEAPVDAGMSGRLLIARIDTLLGMGALDQARALLDAAGPATTPDLFRRSFDVALLTGDEDRACQAMRATPGLAPTFPARIFCLARSGDWSAAALSLSTGQALGHLTPPEVELLTRFLDPELVPEDDTLATPSPVTPLDWRMFEAIGAPLPTSGLPLAFAHAELRDTAGWKAQIEAAERLVRAGAISPNVLLGLYTERTPAASGGVWDRADAFQVFDAALARADPLAVARALPEVWAQMVRMELEVPFATLYAGALAKLPLSAEAARLAFEIALLSPDYERLGAQHAAQNPREAFLLAVTKGSLNAVTPPDSMARAIAPAFVSPGVAPEFSAMLDQLRVGEAILLATQRIATGVQGDLRGVTEGLSLLRRIGLEDVARRAALELMLLERRG